MIELDWTGWIVILISAGFIGMAKTGVPGLGILSVILLANIVPARLSTGLILPILIVGDIFAVSYYRRHAVWKHLVKLLPWAIIGIIPGFFLLGRLNDAQFKPIIGWIVIGMIALRYLHERFWSHHTEVIEGHWVAAIVGVLAGTVTMLANAAGPVMTIYLLAMRLPKNEFIGTGAWYFLIVNCLKVPFSADLGLIGSDSLKINLAMAPMVAVGAFTGIYLARRLPQKVFNYIAEILAGAAAIRLIM